MTEPLRPGLATRVMASLCRICMVCIPARRWPLSTYARKIRVVQDHCPLCGAWVKMKRFEESRRQTADVTP